MVVSVELRALLEEQVRAAYSKFDGAFRAYQEARDALSVSYGDLITFQRALEAATRDSVDPYRPPLVENPLEPAQTQGEEARAKPERRKREEATEKVERITKKSIVRAILISANGNGLSNKEAFESQLPDAPIKLSLADFQRALPRLVSEGEAWKDARGRYHYGQRPENEGSSLHF